MLKICKWVATITLTTVLSYAVWANTYRYFSIDLGDNWVEYVPQRANKKGEYRVVFTNKTQDTAITITAAPKPGKLNTQGMVAEAQKVIDRLQRQNIKFFNANYDEQQGVFAAAGLQEGSQQQWRIVMIQENAVLYTVLFNGTDIDGASAILNTLRAVPEPLFE